MFSAGPFEFARFGRLVLGRNNMTVADHAKVQEKMAARFPAVTLEIQTLVDRISNRVAGLPPAKLLQRAWWGFATRQMMDIEGSGTGANATEDDATALRLVDYVQSVIAATPPRLPYAEEVNDDEWAALSSDVGKLFRFLVHEYPVTRTAFRRKEDPNLDMELEAFQVRAELLWVNVRGHRYQTQERQALAEVLAPHTDALERLFGLDAASLAIEVEKVQIALTEGVFNATIELEAFRKDTINRAVQLIESPEFNGATDPMKTALADPVLAERGRDVMGRLFGLDLFDVEKTSKLPKVLLDELSWSPGEETSFFAPGDQMGWPLRVWPTMRRPFIRVDGRTLCFDRYMLFDYIYRALQRVILRLDPEYRTQWNERQQAVTETLPFEYFEKLLPGAKVTKSIYYRWSVDGAKAQWFEADGLISYDDHLLLTEIKAGAFTWTSPATDLPAHLASLKALLLNPAEQGSRFLKYLESAAEVPLFDAQHNEIGRMRRSDYRHVVLCAVTLDSFTELAARAQHLRPLGIDVGQDPVWVLSIDDLRVYADLFDDPLTFLHFVEQRAHAARSDLVDLDDELDHLGMYLKENHYSRFAQDLAKASGATKPKFDGYRAPVDEFYEAILRRQKPDLPRQLLSPRLAEALTFLTRSDKRGRSQIASFLLDASGETRARIEQAISDSLIEQKALRRSRPMSINGEHAFTLYVWSPTALRDAAAALEHARTVVAAEGEVSRLLLEMVYGPGDVLVNVHWQFVGTGGLANAELARLHLAGERLKRSRVNAAAEKGKIGVNAPCPCGSGRKYKRCHGA